jgi:hypothetical protein
MRDDGSRGRAERDRASGGKVSIDPLSGRWRLGITLSQLEKINSASEWYIRPTGILLGRVGQRGATHQATVISVGRAALVHPTGTATAGI